MENKKDNTDNEREFTILMPDVKDIPGQENIIPPRIREMEDMTISSSDEEGEGILDEVNGDEPDELLMDDATNVGTEERKALSHAGRIITDDTELRASISPDNRDDDDELLNEPGDARDYGEDLDVPGSDEDDQDETIGEEDEENNGYSRPD